MVRTIAIVGFVASALAVQASYSPAEKLELARLVDRHLQDLALNREANVAAYKRELATAVDNHFKTRALESDARIARSKRSELKREEAEAIDRHFQNVARAADARRAHVASVQRRTLSNHRTRALVQAVEERDAAKDISDILTGTISHLTSALTNLGSALQGGQKSYDGINGVLRDVHGTVWNLANGVSHLANGERKRSLKTNAEVTEKFQKVVALTAQIFAKFGEAGKKDAKLVELSNSQISSSAHALVKAQHELKAPFDGPLNDLSKIVFGSVTGLGYLVHALRIDTLLGDILSLGAAHGTP